MEAAKKSRFIISALIMSIIMTEIIRLCGLLVLRQKIFIETNNIYTYTKECEHIKNKNLFLIAHLTDIESPKMLREHLHYNINHDNTKRNLLINVSNWKNYHGNFLERNRIAIRSENKTF